MTPEHPNWWDPHSDQPFRLAPSQKRRATFSHLLEYGKTALMGFAILPFALVGLVRTAATKLPPQPADFVGLGISSDLRSRVWFLSVFSPLYTLDVANTNIVININTGM